MLDFQIDEERGLPFMQTGRRPNDGDDEPSSPRGFNNPNISFSIKFKNKVKNNNFEFIVTIEPEQKTDDQEELKESEKTFSAELQREKSSYIK